MPPLLEDLEFQRSLTFGPHGKAAQVVGIVMLLWFALWFGVAVYLSVAE